MAFTQELRTFNFLKAKTLLDAVTKYENDRMEKQLFEKDKMESMIIGDVFGKWILHEGADEVARQFGKYLKFENKQMITLFDNAKFVKKNCPHAVMILN